MGPDHASSTHLTFATSRPFGYPSPSLSSSSATSSDDSVFSSQASREISPSSSISSHPDNCDSYTQSRNTAPDARLPIPGPLAANIQVPHAGALPADQRRHPRRSNGLAVRCPPTLVRQSERKVNFVDNLVDSSTQIVEAIWPLSTIKCRSEAGSKPVLPLRTFIQETLRRSRTSYSTLQVALYYLILVKPHVPKHDFTMEQPSEEPECRALQCGRRMFLSALILASKYLQDRNYSARAWSKISGLATSEINKNETAFLHAVNWKLHITDEVFQRWTNIVLKNTPPPPPPTSGATSALYAHQVTRWKTVILTANPELNNVEDLVPASFMEPSACDIASPAQWLPAMGLLPSPRATPQPSGLGSPAASAASQILGRGSAMGMAMSKVGGVDAAQNLDRWPVSFSSPQSHLVRRSSLARSVSTASSPESMVSDTSRTSRASSISSVSSLAAAAPAQKLGLPARFRCAKLQSERVCPRSTIPEDYEMAHTSASSDSYTGPVGALDEPSLVETPLVQHSGVLDESDAARALQAMQRYTFHPNVRPTASLARKRSHPEFVENPVQHDVRQMLMRAKTSWPESMVRPLDHSDLEGSPRKRVCCSAEAAAGFRLASPSAMHWGHILN